MSGTPGNCRQCNLNRKPSRNNWVRTARSGRVLPPFTRAMSADRSLAVILSVIGPQSVIGSHELMSVQRCSDQRRLRPRRPSRHQGLLRQFRTREAAARAAPPQGGGRARRRRTAHGDGVGPEAHEGETRTPLSPPHHIRHREAAREFLKARLVRRSSAHTALHDCLG